MKLIAFILSGFILIGVAACDKKVYEKKVESKDEHGNVDHKYQKTVTKDDDGKETTVVKEKNSN